jgi:DNA-binding transcriptional ArsR family regulator
LLNQRLFEIVREEEHLTYDASLSYHLREGLFIISAPSSTYEQALSALGACRAALSSCGSELTPQQLSVHLSRVRQTLLVESRRSQFWLDELHNSELSQTLPAWTAVDQTLSQITPQVALIAPAPSSSPPPPPQRVAELIREMKNGNRLAAFVGTTAPRGLSALAAAHRPSRLSDDSDTVRLSTLLSPPRPYSTKGRF